MLIPLFEGLKAGFPTSTDDTTQENIDLKDFLVERPYSTVYLKVSGESMLKEGIKDGDYIIVDKSIQAQVSDIIVAIVDKEYTLKYLSQDKNGNYYLEPANSDYPPIYPEEELVVFGVVIGVFRKYK
ncbi:LexA family protein [Candidatus Absconditicoccus praedator]|uniref:LexA family protein n=1 Tax=Candidatus Absconditicoccus praedator TaxID=2735562 RepID=UPI001E30D4B3|nr:translesion error-prone DNA polymerase V autoproteolytic subunit [Candidatus Absconditicoccus praedator]UFX82632.1 translesion error-prone DNA polymerase V autoproteolytic subunit [Candidatus Absconditicoccus praedator]